jgi:hypothetical protein
MLLAAAYFGESMRYHASVVRPGSKAMAIHRPRPRGPYPNPLRIVLIADLGDHPHRPLPALRWVPPALQSWG